MVSDTVSYEKLVEAVCLYPCLYNKSSEDYKDVNKSKVCWKDVAAAEGVTSGKGHFIALLWTLNSDKSRQLYNLTKKCRAQAPKRSLML